MQDPPLHWLSSGRREQTSRSTECHGQDEATAKKSLNDQGLQVNVETTTDASVMWREGCVANQSGSGNLQTGIYYYASGLSCA